MANNAREPLVVTVSPDRNIGEVARDLEAAGLDVEQVLDAICVVTGSASADKLTKLRAVQGVADISSEHDIDIGPPGAPVS